MLILQFSSLIEKTHSSNIIFWNDSKEFEFANTAWASSCSHQFILLIAWLVWGELKCVPTFVDINVQSQNVNVSCTIKTLELGYSNEWDLVIWQFVDQNFNLVKNSHLGIWEVQFDPTISIWVSVLWGPNSICNFCDLSLKRTSPRASQDSTTNNLVRWCWISSGEGWQKTNSLCWVWLWGIERA